MPKFALVYCKEDHCLRWFEDWVDHWIDHRAGKTLYMDSSKFEVRDTVEAADFRQLDHKRALLVEDSDAGWLAPDGTFYGCHYMDHDAVAELVLGKRVSQLEREGWIRVPGAGALLDCDLEPTSSQRAWAAERDHAFDCDLDDDTWDQRSAGFLPDSG